MTNSVMLSDFFDDRIFRPRSEWQCINYPYRTDAFLDWMALHIPDAVMRVHYKRARSAGGWGNKGGWIDKPTGVEVIFKSEGAKLMFELEWVL